MFSVESAELRPTMNSHASDSAQGWAIALVLLNLFGFTGVLLSDAPGTELWCFGILVANVALFASYFNRTRDLFEPLNLVISLYCTIVVAGAGAVLLNGDVFYPPAVMWRYYLSTTIGLVALACGYRWAKITRTPLFRVFERAAFSVDDDVFGYWLLFLGVVLGGSVLIHSGLPAPVAYTEWSGDLRLEWRASNASGLVEYFEEGATFLFFAAVLFTGRKHWGSRALALTVAFAYGLLTVMSGRKHIFLFLVALAAMYWHYRIRPMRARYVLPAVVVVYVFAAMFNHVRDTTNLVEMVEKGVGYIREDPSLLSPTKVGELSGVSSVLFDLIERIERGGAEYSWGGTYVSEILTWVPRFVWPDRPLPLSEKYMHDFYPEDYDKGYGRGLFMPVSGYWAFGPLGVGIDFFCYGAILGGVYRLFRANDTSDAVFCLYCVVICLLAGTTLRSGLIGTLRQATMAAAPLVGLMFLARAGKVRRRLSTL